MSLLHAITCSRVMAEVHEGEKTSRIPGHIFLYEVHITPPAYALKFCWEKEDGKKREDICLSVIEGGYNKAGDALGSLASKLSSKKVILEEKNERYFPREI